MSRQWLWPWVLIATVWFGGAGVAQANVMEFPPILDIGSIDVGQTKTAEATVTADAFTTNVSVVLGATSDCAFFQITAPAFPISVGPISPDNDVKVTVKFTATASGDHMCAASVKQGSTTLANFTVKGHARAATIALLQPPLTIPLKFDHLEVGQQKTLQVKIQNIGEAALTISSATFTMGEANYALAGGPTGPIAPSGTVTWDITCKPSNSGSVDSVFRIDSNSSANPNAEVALKCIGDQGVLYSGGTSLDFGPVFRGSTQTMTAFLSNVGNVPVTGIVGQISPSGAGYAFDPTTPVPSTLSPFETAQVKVILTPERRGDGGQATLSFSGVWGSSAKPATFTMMLTGTEVSFSLPQAPTALDFGMFRFDSVQSQTFQIVNDGSAALQIQTAFTPDPGTAAEECDVALFKDHVVRQPPVALAIDESLEVRVAPKLAHRIGLISGTLEVTSDAGGSQKLALTGVATSALVKISPTLDFGTVDINGVPQMQTLAIENTGDGPLDVMSFAMSGETPGSEPSRRFMLLAPDLPFRIGPGTTAHIPIVYKPSNATELGLDRAVLTTLFAGSFDATATTSISGEAAFAELRGGGGCDARAPERRSPRTLGLVLASLLYLWRRRRRRFAGLAFVGALVMAAAAPPARADDIGITAFQPTTTTGSASFELQTPDLGTAGSWATSAVVSYASNPLLMSTVTSSGRSTNALVARSTLMQLGAAYAINDWLEAGARFPLYQQSGDTGPVGQPASGFARGNLALHGKVRLWRGELGPILTSTGLGASAVLPTASKGQFTGSDQPALRLLALGSFTPSALGSRLALSINAGAILRSKSVYANLVEQSAIAWGVGATYRITDAVSASAEAFGEATPSGRVTQSGSMGTARQTVLAPMECLAGINFRPQRRVSVGVAIGRGVTSAAGSPDLRGVLSLAFVPEAAAIAPLRSQVIAEAPPAPAPERKPTPATVPSAPSAPPVTPPPPAAAPPPPSVAPPPQVAHPAADPPEPAATAASTKAAEEAFAKGRDLMKQRKYAAACGEFERSQRLDPQLGTQYNLAGCHDKVGKLATAWNLYREIVRHDANAVRRTKAGELADALERRLPKLKLVLSRKPAGTQVVVNGADAGAQIDVEQPVDFGRYTVTATAPGYRAWQTSVEVAEEGRMVVVTIDLQPVR